MGMTQTIKYVSIKNFKGIKEIQTENLWRFVAVFGANGAGKSSFIEAIKNAIKLEKGWNQKVRIGEEKWEIVVQFEDFVIKRVIGKNGDLKVEHNGELVQRPQSWLDNIFLGTIWDPNKFLQFHDKDKIKYLLETQGKKQEYDLLEDQRLPKYEARKDKHRTYLAKKEEVEQTDPTEFDSIETWLDEKIQWLQKQLSEIEAQNEEYHTLKGRISKWDDLIKTKQLQLDYRNKKIADLEAQLKMEKENLVKDTEEFERATQLRNDLQIQLDNFNKIDGSDLIDKINQLNNKKSLSAELRAKKDLYEKQITQRDQLYVEWKELDDAVKNIEQQQNDLIKWLDIGYDLKLEDGIMSVKINDSWIPLDELNKATQIEIWVDICLKWPNKIKIITIEDANALDPNTLERIKEKIEKYDAQCFLETVYNTGYEEITIKDGELLSQNN